MDAADHEDGDGVGVAGTQGGDPPPRLGAAEQQPP
jgi:hypothetical protein